MEGLNLSGNWFGNLHVVSHVRNVTELSETFIIWKCKCTCGNTVEVIENHLLDGSVKKCDDHKDIDDRVDTEYPFNMFFDLGIIETVEGRKLELLMDYIENAIDGLDERDKMVMNMYYREMKDISSIAKSLKTYYYEIDNSIRSSLQKLSNPTMILKILNETGHMWTKEEIENSIGDIFLENAGLSARAYNVLKRNGFNTVKEVALYGEENIRKLNNVGRITVTEICSMINKYI